MKLLSAVLFILLPILLAVKLFKPWSKSKPFILADGFHCKWKYDLCPSSNIHIS